MRNLRTSSRVSRSSLFGFAISLASLLFLAQSPTTLAQSAQDKIAFSRDAQLWIMNGDGSNQTSLGAAAQGRYPSWSPDGKKIAFTCGYENTNICVIDADGTNMVQLTFGGGYSRPAWSPDGTRIAYTYNATEPHIYLMNPDGSNQQPLFINNPSIVASNGAAWSSDGTRIAFVGGLVSDTDPSVYYPHIYTMKVDGSEPPVFKVADVPIESELAWSSDGTKLAYTTFSGKSIIHVINLDGTNSGIALLMDGDQNLSPAWSPDGTQLAFFRESVYRDGNGDPVSRESGILVLNISTGLITNLNAPNGETPAYRPAVVQPQPGPAERIQNLIKKVEDFGLPFGTTNSLTVKLRHALNAYNAGDIATACSDLAAFINQVGAQSGKKLTAAQASEISTEAAAIRKLVGCQ
jgi:Tol biopolymer transport system component